MPEPLWRVRQRKGMSINQLAAKSGVPAISIAEYESGHAIRSADLPKLARALYVEEWDIELKSRPRPKTSQTEPSTSAPAAAPQPKRAKSPTTGAAPTPPRAKASQIEHLLNLTTGNFDQDRSALEKEIGKPLEEMSRVEASQLLKHYQQLLAESRSSPSSDAANAKRKRAYLPEGVDEFELHYLSSLQESRATLRFMLFDGQQLSGNIIGFSPYSITIQEEETGEELTLQKLAIVYYRVASRTNGAETPSPLEQPTGDE